MKLSKVKLSDIAIVNMGQSPSSLYYNNEKKGLPFLQGNRTFGRIYPYFDTYTTLITKKANEGDVLMSVRAPVGHLNIAPKELCIGRGLCSIRMKNNNQFYLYYLLNYYNSELLNRENGTVFGSINKKSIDSLEVFVHDNINQKKITKILLDIDKKIELNNKINDNLLKLALNFYELYFKECINYGYIGDYCKVKSGFAFKGTWWSDKGTKVIKIKSILQDNLCLDYCSYVNDDRISVSKEFLVNPGDLVIAMTGATIGKFTMIPYVKEKLLVNQRVGKFFLGDDPLLKLPFIYCTLKQHDINYELINKGQGSAQPNISGNDIMNIKCKMPSLEKINEFNKNLKPVFEMYIKNQYNVSILVNIRDSLLPKLMSGEIDVSNIDI